MIYTLVWVSGLCFIWMIWEFGYKACMLDRFRAHLFELRDRLFSFAEGGGIDFDNDAYRSVELLLNGVIRYAHRCSFLTYCISSIEVARAKKSDKDYVDFGRQMTMKLSRLNPEAQSVLSEILRSLHKGLALYMFGTSLLFKGLAVFVAIKELRITRFKEAKQKMAKQVIVLEGEAYREAYIDRRESRELIPA
jgi:hypothetical protein